MPSVKAERAAGAGVLERARVGIALSTRGVKDTAEFWKRLRQAVKAGLSREAALAALTENPARMLGLERQLGSVEPGKIAALTVMSGDFLDEKAKVRYLFIDRRKFDVEREKAEPRPGRPMAAGVEEEDR